MADIALETCDYRLLIRYVDDVRFTWYTFEVWIVGWVLKLAMGDISAMDILTTMNTCYYFWIKFFVLGILVGTGFYDLLM